MARFYYGGQAVFEGVMMRGRQQATVVVRRADGQLVSHSEQLPPVLYRSRAGKLPFVRGVVTLWETMILGTRMMLFSADVRARSEIGAEIPRRLVITMMAVALAFAVGVFFVVPLLAVRAGGLSVHHTLTANLLEGLVRLALFIGYISLIGRLNNMRLVFQYHGAEHKTINAFEAGAPLTPASVQRFSTVHVRCGTAFLLWVVLVSVVVFALIGHPPLWIGVASRVLLLPVIAGISYEILRLGARFWQIGPVRAVLQPGLWLQRLTTRQPSDDQVMVAIAALERVLAADGVPVPNASIEPSVVPASAPVIA